MTQPEALQELRTLVGLKREWWKRLNKFEQDYNLTGDLELVVEDLAMLDLPPQCLTGETLLKTLLELCSPD